jgi:Ca2+-binding EF-hand superfamily protein
MAEFDQEQFGKLCQALADRDKAGIDVAAPIVFKDIDKNGNGLLDKEEILAFAGTISNDAERTAAEMMNDLDYNNDGKIEVDEWVKFWHQKAGLE